MTTREEDMQKVVDKTLVSLESQLEGVMKLDKDTMGTMLVAVTNAWAISDPSGYLKFVIEVAKEVKFRMPSYESTDVAKD